MERPQSAGQVRSRQLSADGSDIRERTFVFAVKIVKLAERLNEAGGVGWVLSKQILRSGTSIGANLEEARAGESRADFIHKVSIALKEARETRYWLRLLVASNVVKPVDVRDLIKEAEALTSILAAILVSTSRSPD